MRTLIQFLPLVFVVLVVVSLVRNAARVMRKMQESQPEQPPTPAHYDPAMADRTRRIQEEIRRKIAERRGTVVARPPSRAETIFAPPEPPPLEEPVQPTYVGMGEAELERQEQLAEEMHTLEATRAAEHRRAAQAAIALQTEAESERGLLVGSRGSLLADLRDPQSLRRAFVLREVLGAPVGLR